MVAEQFNFAKDELLLSLADGNDLAFSAAEYIIAWESLNKAPTDTLSRSLKYTAELIQKEEEDKATRVEKLPSYKEGPGFLLAHHPQGDPDSRALSPR